MVDICDETGVEDVGWQIACEEGSVELSRTGGQVVDIVGQVGCDVPGRR